MTAAAIGGLLGRYRSPVQPASSSAWNGSPSCTMSVACVDSDALLCLTLTHHLPHAPVFHLTFDA